ncbi:colony stimulating factor 3 (granulocyte) a isoform X2 [Esox lucius]|nr:colony stimulating factor 3 (granulocyte) a isoform X2 [Esox lucius]XP_019901971.2 colony stimulating factor 3 (granulocyte) a isoform X2 [Esox lucius]
MARVGYSAPLMEYSGETGQLVEDPEFHIFVENSQNLIKKVLEAIPGTHKSCIHSETLILNSTTENRKLQYMATNLGIPSAPTLKALAEDFTLETCLRHMSEGLQLHQDLLKAVQPRLANTENLTALMTDIRDLGIQINKMLRAVQAEVTLQPTVTSLASRLTGDYQVQVAAHLTLVQLQSFGQDIVRSLRNIALVNGDRDDSGL